MALPDASGEKRESKTNEIEVSVDAVLKSALSAGASIEETSVGKGLAALAIEHAVDNPNFLQQMADTLAILSHNLVAGDNYSSETFLQRLHLSGLGVEHQVTFLQFLNDLRVQSESANDWHQALRFLANVLERPDSIGSEPFKSAAPSLKSGKSHDSANDQSMDSSSLLERIGNLDDSMDNSSKAISRKSFEQIQVSHVLDELTKWSMTIGLDHDVYSLPGYSLPAGFDSDRPTAEHIAWMRRIEREITHQDYRTVQEVSETDRFTEPSNYHEPMQIRLAVLVREKIAALLREATDLSKLNHLSDSPFIEQDLVADENDQLVEGKMKEFSISSHLVDLNSFAPARPN